MNIGDRVSVLDEDLKGKIISILGDVILIEDEYGFHHSFHTDKIVPIHQDFYDDFTTIKKEENTRNISKKHKKNSLKLDLHFEQLVEFPDQYSPWERLFIQKEKLMDTLDFCRKNGIKSLLIIHGLGDGTLQEMVYSVLRGYTYIDFEENEFFKHSSASVEIRFI